MQASSHRTGIANKRWKCFHTAPFGQGEPLSPDYFGLIWTNLD